MKRLLIIGFLFCGFGAIAQSLEEGKKALELDQFNKAKMNFMMRLSAAGDEGAQAHLLLSDAYIKTSRTDSANMVLDRFVKLNPQSPFAKIAWAKIALLKKDDASAKSFMDEAVTVSQGKSAKVYEFIASAWLLNAEKPLHFKYAADAATAGLKLDPKSADLYILFGDGIKRDANGGGSAASAYSKALDLKTNDAKSLQRMGVLYAEARNYDAAGVEFDKSLAVNNEYAPALWEYAFMYYNWKKYDKALELYKKYMAVTDTTVLSLTRYIYALHLNKMYSDEIPYINRLMEMDSTNCTIYRLLAYAYAEQKKDAANDSIALYNIRKLFICMDPAKILPLDYKYYGRLLSRTGSDSLAIIQLDNAYKLDTTDAEILQEYGDVLYKAKKYIDAAQIYSAKIYNQKSTSALDYFSLGKAYYYGKDYLNADTAFAKIVELKPSNPTGHIWLGRTSLKLAPDSIDKAYIYFSKFLELGDVPDTKSPQGDLIDA